MKHWPDNNTSGQKFPVSYMVPLHPFSGIFYNTNKVKSWQQRKESHCSGWPWHSQVSLVFIFECESHQDGLKSKKIKTLLNDSKEKLNLKWSEVQLCEVQAAGAAQRAKGSLFSSKLRKFKLSCPRQLNLCNREPEAKRKFLALRYRGFSFSTVTLDEAGENLVEPNKECYFMSVLFMFVKYKISLYKEDSYIYSSCLLPTVPKTGILSMLLHS